MLAIIEAEVISDRDRLNELESAIDSALSVMSEAWMEIADALREIRDARLYELCGVTFETYFSSKWPALGLARSTVYEWIDAAEVVRNVEAQGEPAPVKISHARALRKLAPLVQSTALSKAREIAREERGAPEPTEHEVKRAVSLILEEPPPPAPAEERQAREQKLIAQHITRLWRSLTIDSKRQLLEELGAALADEIAPETTVET